MSDVNYTYLGNNGEQAGPHDLQFIQGRVSAGAIRRDTFVWRSDLPDWLPAESFTELVWPALAKAVPAMPVVSAKKMSYKDVDMGTLAEMRGHASWFWIIAVVNVIFAFIGMSTAEGDGKTDILVGGIFIAVVFSILGFFAYRAHRWAFVVGLVLLAIDLVFLVLGMRIVGILIRGYAIYQVFQGFQIARGIQQTLKESR